MEQYQQHIEPDAPQATTPEELHPLAAAFGGDIGAALEKSGEQVSSRIEQLAQHMSMMNYYRGQQAVADKVLQMKNDQNSVFFGDPNNPNATVTKTKSPIESISSDSTLSVGGAPSSTAPFLGSQPESYEVPAGILQRKGNEASGALQDYHDWYTNYSQQMINQARNEGLGDRNIRSMKLRMDTDFASNGKYIAQHEATELDKAQQQTFLKGMQLDADNAVIKQDPISLGRTIDSINHQNQVLNDSQGKAKDDPIREITSNKFISQALNNSMTANLKSTGGDPTQFQSTLDRLHDDGKINDTVYDNANSHLTTMSQNIQRQFKITAQANQVSNRLNTFMSIASGKINSNSSPSIISDIASSDPELGNAVNTIIDSNGKYKPERKDRSNLEYQKSVTDMINSSSQKQLTDYLTKSLGDTKSLTSTRMNILINALMQHAKTLPVLDEQAGSSTPQNLTSSTFNALNDWADKAGLSPDDKSKAVDSYLKGMAGNISPKQNYDTALRNYSNSVYPHTATMESPPSMVIDKNGDARKLFPIFNKDVKVHPMMRWEEEKKAEGDNPLVSGGQELNKESNTET